ncbi:MAG TPA: GNAT family N-acetyltransferase [Mycobacteriales bacterium]|nr:GNAT family N-acetyltransferase [Mycobacteriales bacterium]
MELRTFDHVDDFAARVLPRLEADEAQFNLALAVISSLQSGRIVPDRAPFLASIRDGEEDIAVLHTPPHGLLLTGLPEGSAPAVVDAVLSGGYRPPLVVGPPEAVEPVTAQWCARTGQVVGGRRAQGIYAASRLVPPPAVDGGVQVATAADGDTVFDWFCAFSDELGLLPRTSRAVVDARVAAGDIALWCTEDGPVSMAGIGGRTTRGARIGPVYTPAAHRSHGYAAAVTAAQTQRCFDQGADRCFLYTDLANPTSNAIYQRLGYERVADSLEITFSAVPA